MQSRYYDPVISRMLNADDTDVITASMDDVTDKNLYAYCDNNPIMRKDADGGFWMLIAAGVGALIGCTCSAITQYATTGKIDPKTLFVDTVSGAASGLLASTGVGLVGAIVGNAVISGATYAAGQAVQGQAIRGDELLFSATIGGASGAIGGRGLKTSTMKGIWSTSKNVLKTAVSPKKIAMYTAKKLIIKKTLIKATARAGIAAASVSVSNTQRRAVLKRLEGFW